MEDKDLELFDFNIDESGNPVEPEAIPTEEAEVKAEVKTERIDPEEKKYGIIAEVLSWTLTVLVALFIAIFLKNFVIINATVPTGSMENTIMPDDDLFGFRLAYTFDAPKRGDIIIFEYPDDPTEKYIKRIVGLPGESVEIQKGKIYINGSKEPLEEAYLKEEWTYMNDGYSFLVPENSYLVLGDNRNQSWDSRFWKEKYVSAEKIIGKAGFRYYPFKRWGMVK